MIYVIGGNGFVGSAFVRKFEKEGIEHQVITKQNFEEFKGTSCELLINANGNSKKFLSSENPLLDFDLSTRSVLESLISFKSDKYIFLSSGDVYPDQSSPDTTSENQVISPEKQSNYGCHKYLAELLVRRYAQDWIIFRMGGFIGPGLKKNPVYDMITNSKLWLNLDSELQYISTDTAAELIMHVYSKDITKQIINIGGKGVISLKEIYKLIESTSSFDENLPKVRFELDISRFEELLNPAFAPSSAHEVVGFLKNTKY